jgi:hypothetical protein
LSLACGGSEGNAAGGASGQGGGAGGQGGASSGPGPLVDNTQWVPTQDGEALIGSPPPDAVCDLTPMECDDLYPWPEGECVVLTGTPCVTAYAAECLDTFTVLAVYTRMPNPTEPLCNWLTLEQPSLRDIRAGDRVEIRMRHSALDAPQPNGSARMMFVIGDEVALVHEVLIPSGFDFPDAVWTAPKDYPAGTELLFHVDNHGSNEYMLIEVNVL